MNRYTHTVNSSNLGKYIFQNFFYLATKNTSDTFIINLPMILFMINQFLCWKDLPNKKISYTTIERRRRRKRKNSEKVRGKWIPYIFLYTVYCIYNVRSIVAIPFSKSSSFLSFLLYDTVQSNKVNPKTEYRIDCAIQ